MAKIPEINLVDIQAELDELIGWPNGSLTPVHAKRSHQAMEKSGDGDMVTDTPAENSFIFSSNGGKDGIKITRQDAKDMIIGIKRYPYSENKKGKEPELFTLDDIIFRKGEKKISPANAAKRIQSKFKVTERDDDIFDAYTDELNKQNRKPYLTAVAVLSEVERMKKEMNQAMPEIELIPTFKKGGIVREKHLDKMQDGGGEGGGGGFGDILGGLLDFGSGFLPEPFGSIAGGILDIFGIGGGSSAEDKAQAFQEQQARRSMARIDQIMRQRRGETAGNILQANRLFDRGIEERGQAFDLARSGIAGDTIMQALGLAVQDPTVQFTEVPTTFLDEIDVNAPMRNAARLAQQNIGLARSFDRSLAGLNPAAAASLMGAQTARALGTNTQVMSGAQAQQQALINSLLQQRQANLATNLAGRDRATNLTRQNQNVLLNALSQGVGGGFREFQGTFLPQSRELFGLGLDKLQTEFTLEDKLLQDLLSGEGLKISTYSNVTPSRGGTSDGVTSAVSTSATEGAVGMDRTPNAATTSQQIDPSTIQPANPGLTFVPNNPAQPLGGDFNVNPTCGPNQMFIPGLGCV